MVKYQSKAMGELHPDQHKSIGHTPYSGHGHEEQPVSKPQREGPSTVQRVSDFLQYDEDSAVDAYATTRGTTNGYTPSNGSAGRRRQRGNGYAGIYLDDPAPRPHERTNKSAQNPRRSHVKHQETGGHIGQRMVEQVPDFYYGASHARPARDPHEPRKMGERFMTRVEKYEADWEAKNTAADLTEVGHTQLEEAAYARSEERARDQAARQGLIKYDPWGTDLERNPKIGKEISGARDDGHISEIPAMQMRDGDEMPDDPYRDYTAERHNHIFLSGTTEEYQDKWLDKGDPVQQHGDHRKVIELGGPTATVNQNEMVRTRFKEEAAGFYHAHDAHHKTHYLSSGRHYTDSGETGPPIIPGGELSNPQVARSMHNDFVKAEMRRAEDMPDIMFGHGEKPQAKGLHGSWDENSIYGYEARHHSFTKDRPNQTWN